MLQATGLALADVSTPKLSASDPSRLFYEYYAGYSELFVEDILRHLGARRGQTLLDPWNGAGTSTTVASYARIESVGFDLNPVLVSIARARTVAPIQANQIIETLCDSVARGPKLLEAVDSTDALLRWFGPDSVVVIRAFEALLRQATSADTASRHVRSIDPPLALLYLLLFRVLRRAAAPLLGSNPTWIKHGTAERRLSITQKSFAARFEEEAVLALQYFDLRPDFDRPSRPRIKMGSSTHLRGIVDGSVDYVITSPPYCTRIDYAIATAIELALLSSRYAIDLNKLRSQLIGTTLTRDVKIIETSCWGAAARRFLSQVRKHPSKASKTYYARYYANYFSRMQRSFQELSRVVVPGGRAVIVAQSSYYKDIYLDLGNVFADMLARYRWKLQDRQDFVVKVSFTNLNPRGKAYPKERPPIESALVFAKE